MVKYLAKGYLWALLLLLYSPILIIMIFSFTEAKVLGNWTGFSTKLYSSLFAGNVQHSLVSALWNTFAIAMIAATVSTLLGSVAAIGIFNLKARARNAVSFVNNIPMLNPDIITGISLFLLFVSLGISQGLTTVVLTLQVSVFQFTDIIQVDRDTIHCLDHDMPQVFQVLNQTDSTDHITQIPPA